MQENHEYITPVFGMVMAALGGWYAVYQFIRQMKVLRDVPGARVFRKYGTPDEIARTIAAESGSSLLESSQTKLHMESVILPDVINDCLMALEYEIRKRALDVSMNLEQIKVQADPDQLGRVVMNLISNAVKYAESRIYISCEKNYLRIVNDGDVLDEEEKTILDKTHEVYTPWEEIRDDVMSGKRKI